MLDGHRICLPTDHKVYNSIKSGVNVESLTKSMNDIKNTWTIALACAFIALALSLGFLFFVRYCAGFITWFFIVTMVIMLFLLGALFAVKYQKLSSAQ